MGITKLERGMESGTFSSLVSLYLSKIEEEYDFKIICTSFEVLDFGDKQFKEINSNLIVDDKEV